MSLFGMSSEKLVRPVYETQRPLPWLNFVRPPTIVSPDGQKGIFRKAELNENGKHNIHLDTGHVIYNIDESNLKVVSGFFSLLAGDAVIVCNLTPSGLIIPWEKMARDESSMEILKMQRDHYKEVAMTAEDSLMTAAGGNKMYEKMEAEAEAFGRLSSKSHGKMVFGRQELQERMTPELEQLVGGMSGGGEE
jgi:hypothetical protein